MMMSDIDKQIELVEAEKEQAYDAYETARFRLVKLQRKQEEQEAARVLKETGIEVYHSGDYAGMKCGNYSFYFGYEETFCTTHPTHVKCDCADEEWAFVARDSDDKELMRLPQSKLASKSGDMVEYLLHGIGQFMDTLPKPVEKQRIRMFDDTGTTGDSAGDPR